MLSRENYLELKKTIDELAERSKSGAVIVVEGVRDRESLRNLGIKGEIVVFSSYVNVVDQVGSREVIILTDYDKRGNKIERGLISKFSSWGIIPDTSIKKKIFSLISKEITAVENLANYVKKVENEIK